MAEREKPTIVFIDDDQEELTPLAKNVEYAGMLGCKVDSPEDVDIELLRNADLVIVDFNLDKWIDKLDNQKLSHVPSNGIALSAVMREHYRKPSLTHYPPTGFALITGEPTKVCSTPGEQRPHVVARLSNLEWYFEKQDDPQKNVRQIASLASAIHGLPQKLSNEIVGFETLMELLGVQVSDALAQRYSESVSYCRPPIHHLSKESGGLVLIRWLLHRILPHTCFLLSQTELAARLRVSPKSLSKELNSGNQFSEALSPYLYRGLLADFDGSRWWRGGIEQLLWDLTDGSSMDSEAIFKATCQLGGSMLEKTDLDYPVATINETLNTESTLSDIEDVCSLQLDDWPSYAEPAYMRKDLLDTHQELKLFVAPNQGFA